MPCVTNATRLAVTLLTGREKSFMQMLNAHSYRSVLFPLFIRPYDRHTPQTPLPPLIPSQSSPVEVRILWGAQLRLLTS